MQQEIKPIADNMCGILSNFHMIRLLSTVNGYLKRKLRLMVLCLVIRVDLLLKVFHRNMVNYMKDLGMSTNVMLADICKGD